MIRHIKDSWHRLRILSIQTTRLMPGNFMSLPGPASFPSVDVLLSVVTVTLRGNSCDSETHWVVDPSSNKQMMLMTPFIAVFAEDEDEDADEDEDEDAVFSSRDSCCCCCCCLSSSSSINILDAMNAVPMIAGKSIVISKSNVRKNRGLQIKIQRHGWFLTTVSGHSSLLYLLRFFRKIKNDKWCRGIISCLPFRYHLSPTLYLSLSLSLSVSRASFFRVFWCLESW